MKKKEHTVNEALATTPASMEKNVSELSEEPLKTTENPEDIEEKDDTEKACEAGETRETREARETRETREAIKDSEQKAGAEKSEQKAEAEKSEQRAEAEKSEQRAEAEKSEQKAGVEKTEQGAGAEKSEQKAGVEKAIKVSEAGENRMSEPALPETGDEALDAALRQLAQDMRDGRWSKHSLQLLRHGLNYDIDMAKARHEGEVAGRNLRINEYLIERREPAGIHNLTGGGSSLARSVPAERLGGLTAAEKPSIWQRGNEKRIVRG